MKVLIEGTALRTMFGAAGHTGVGRWTFEVLQGLAKARPGWDLEILWVGSEPPPVFEGKSPGDISVRQIKLSVRLHRWLLSAGLWPSAERVAGHADVFLGPSFTTWRTASAPSVPVVHDLAYLRAPDSLAPRNLAFLKTNMGRVLRRAASVVVVSRAVKEDVIEHYGIEAERIFVVPGGQRALADGSPSLVLPERYLLWVGTLEPRKNLPVLLEAHRLLSAEHEDVPPLVLIGAAGWKRSRWMEALDRAERSGRVIQLGFVPDADLRAAYRGAEALVFPSLYEGFGLPVLEAMSEGCPVISSAVGAIPEFAARSVLFVDPADPSGIADAMRVLLEDEGLRERLAREGRDEVAPYTWEAASELLAQSLEATVARKDPG